MFFLETFCDTPYFNFGPSLYTLYIVAYTFDSLCIYIGYDTGVYIFDYIFNGILNYSFDSPIVFIGYIGGFTDVLENKYVCGCIYKFECTSESGPVWS